MGSNTKFSKRARHAFMPAELREYGLPLAPFRIYFDIVSRCNWDNVREVWTGWHFASVETMAASCRVNVKTLKKWLKILVSLRLLNITARAGQTNIYSPTLIHEWEASPYLNPRPKMGGAKRSPKGGPKRGPHPPAQTEPPKVTPKEGTPLRGGPPPTFAPVKPGLFPGEYQDVIDELKEMKKRVLEVCGERRLTKEAASWLEYAKTVERPGIEEEIRQKESDPRSYEFVHTDNSKAHIAAYNARIGELKNAKVGMNTKAA